MLDQEKLLADIRELLDLWRDGRTYARGIWMLGWFASQFCLIFAACVTFGSLVGLLELGIPLYSSQWLQLLLSLAAIPYIVTLMKVSRHSKRMNKSYARIRNSFETALAASKVDSTPDALET